MAGAALTAHEREEIRVGIENEESASAIARRLGRVTSTITREVKRNGGRKRYSATRAEGQALKQRRRPKRCVLQRNERLAVHVMGRLHAKDSPTTIVKELERAGGLDGDTVSPETIYQAIYANGTRGLPSGLGRHLHRKRSRRRRRRAKGDPSRKASVLGTFTPIHSRPKSAEGRREVGHFEGDLIIGERNKSAILTLVDRASRFNLIGDLPGGHDAENVLACAVELLERVPEALRQTLTWDQGTEMARHSELAELVDIDVYFADKHSPPLRISMGSCDATSARAPICPSTHPKTSRPSVIASTRCRDGSFNGGQLLIATMLLSLL